MEFFVYSRDAEGTRQLREDAELADEHWSYMDEFAESMTARGPTLAGDRDSATGSLHILELPDIEALHEFVAHEPNNRAGLYAEHSIWRFDNLLGRTIWEFSGTSDEPKFLIIARQVADGSILVPPARLSVDLRDRLILYGTLRALQHPSVEGVAFAVQAPDTRAVCALLQERWPEIGHRAEIEIHNWEFGGRR